MTFYWWSHWFWITSLLCIMCVLAHPSQRLHSAEVSLKDKEEALKEVTKLYQTTAALTWSSTPINSDIVERTILKSIASSKDLDELLDDDADIEEVEEVLNADNLGATFAEQIEQTGGSLAESGDEFKRSAEVPGEAKENVDFAYDSSKDPVKVLKEEKFETFQGPDKESARPSQPLLKSNTSRTQDLTRTKEEGLEKDETPGVVVEEQVTVNASVLVASNLTQPASNFSEAMASEASIMVINSTESYEDIHKVPFTLENVNREEEIRRAENEHRTRKPKVLSADYKKLSQAINYSSPTKSLLTRSASTESSQYTQNNNQNIASEALSIERTYFLDASSISAICFTIFGLCCIVGTVGIVLYRRRFLNKPQTLSEPDSSIYIDDSTLRVSDNSDEMYSLDNDSFLNSLEAMTIQNYWTDTVKHTKL